MPSDDRDPAYLWDMLDASERAREVVAGLQPEAFSGDEVRKLALERAMEIIGEAARRVSIPFQKAHPEIPWRQIIGQRNILAHEYGRIDHVRLYRTAKDDLPELIETLRQLLPPVEE